MEVYLDNAATTKTDPEVVDAMLPYLTEEYGNASSSYALGRRAREAVDKAREQIASLINASPEEIYFTSGATESNNWILSKAYKCVMSEIEHPSVLRAFDTPTGKKQKNGFVTMVGVFQSGMVSTEAYEEAAAAIANDYRPMVTLMYANNEIGVLEPIKRVSSIAWDLGVPFHTDATQALGHVPIDVEDLDICYLSASAHKIYGPKGVGMLYARINYEPPAFMRGGHQECGLRAGTENVAGIVGFGKAAELAKQRMEEDAARETELRDYFIGAVFDEIPCANLNGHPEKRLPNNISFTFDGVDGSALLAMLEQDGIYASSGSACTTGSREPSHVLTAIGHTYEETKSTIRFSLGRETTMEQIDYTLTKLRESVQYLRELNRGDSNEEATRNKGRTEDHSYAQRKQPDRNSEMGTPEAQMVYR